MLSRSLSSSVCRLSQKKKESRHLRRRHPVYVCAMFSRSECPQTVIPFHLLFHFFMLLLKLQIMAEIQAPDKRCVCLVCALCTSQYASVWVGRCKTFAGMSFVGESVIPSRNRGQREAKREKEWESLGPNSVWNCVRREHTLLEVDSRSWMQTGNQSRGIRHTRHDRCNQRMLPGNLQPVVPFVCRDRDPECTDPHDDDDGREEQKHKRRVSERRRCVSKGRAGRKASEGANIPSARAPRGQNRSVSGGAATGGGEAGRERQRHVWMEVACVCVRACVMAATVRDGGDGSRGRGPVSRRREKGESAQCVTSQSA